jgi:hypothetical protein
MSLPTFADVVNAKSLSHEERIADFTRLADWPGMDNGVKLIGNPYIQSYMTEHMGKTRFEGKPSLKEVLDDPTLSQTLYKHTSTKTRLEINMPQAFSRMNPVCFMKPSVAKFIYKTFKATKVLDFTAGWGGRMLGALASDIEYIGIDTNVSLRPAYEAMMAELSPLSKGKATMLWEDCREVDFSKLEYDFVFTSPPYCNKELYEHMTPFESPKTFYTEFLIPMLHKSLTHIKSNGWVCLNIDADDYKALCRYGFREADRTEEFQQSTRKRKDGSVKMETVYCWKSGGVPPAPAPVPVRGPVPSCSGCERCCELEQEVARLKAALRNLLG